MTDYGLGQGSAGNALLAFRDDRSGAAQVTVARVGPGGAMLWGDGGLRLTQVAGDVFVGPPKVAGTTDGQVLAAWSEDNVIKVRRLEDAGRPVWAEDLVLGAGSSDQLFLADLHAGPNGGFILSCTRTASFNAPRHLYAQRYTRVATPLWGAPDGAGGRAPLPVFVDGTLQYGNFPPFVPDTEGGAVFGWYETDPVLQVRVQHVRPDGSTRFPAGGALTATARPDLERVEPAVAFDTFTDDIYAFWRERPVASGPFRQALRGQRFDRQGQRLWGDDGKELEPMGGDEMTQLNATVFHGELNPVGAVLFAWVTKLAEGDQRVWARMLDETGADAAWAHGRVAVSSVGSGKARLTVSLHDTLGWGDSAVLGWQDGRAGNDDIYLEKLIEDGSLAPGAPTPTPTQATAPPPTTPSPGVPTVTPSPIVPRPTPRALYLPKTDASR